MAVKFLDPGGDATFNVAVTTAGGFWNQVLNTPTVVTDFVHGTHIKSIEFSPNITDRVRTATLILSDSGSRLSFYIYLVTLPNANATIFNTNNSILNLKFTSAGVLQLFDASGTQIGSDGPALSTGIWYRISMAYVITDADHNDFRIFVDSVLSITATNFSFTLGTGTSQVLIGNISANATLDFRLSDIYIDDSSSLTDTGNIWVTAKRPNANGTTNGFTGSGVGSGYGTGNSVYVNERPLSTASLVSKIGAGSATTEEYNIEAKNVGDIDISNSTTYDLLSEDGTNLLQENSGFILLENANQNAVVDYMGWAYMSALVGETVQMIVNGTNYSQAITSTNTMYTKYTGFGGYPAGTGADIGIITDTSLTTVSLFECGIVVAYIPATVTTNIPFINNQYFQLLGVGT